MRVTRRREPRRPHGELVASTTPDAIHVVEVSSFQLEPIETFHPWIAVMVNLSADHLDRHPDIELVRRGRACG